MKKIIISSDALAYLCLLFLVPLGNTVWAASPESDTEYRLKTRNYSKTPDVPPLPLVKSICLTFPEAAIAGPHTVYIPFKKVGRLIGVQAKADTVSGTFIIDTGAERLLLNRRYFDDQPNLETIAAVGNTGKVGSVSYERIDSFMLDNLIFERVTANVLDLSHIEEKKKIRLVGILGVELFEDFELFLDFQFERIMLTRLDRKGNRLDSAAMWETPYDSLEFKLYQHFIVLKGEVNGIPLKFGLDTGAELNLIDRRVERKIIDFFAVIKRVKMLGAGQQSIEVLAGSLSEVAIGNQLCDPMRTLLTSLTHMNAQFGARMDGVLGYEFLATRRTMINYRQRKLYFFRNVDP